MNVETMNQVENNELTLNVEISTDAEEYTLETEISPAGLELNSNSWNMREAIEAEISPALNAMREARAKLFARLEDRYEPLILPPHFALATKESE